MTSPHSQYEQRAKEVSETDEGLVDKATGAVRAAADQASDVVDRAVEQGRKVGVMAQKAPQATRDALDMSLRQQPTATLAIAGAVGFLLGALWKS